MGHYAVKKVIDFCYGHRLLDYPGKCRHLHGHNGQLELEIDAAALDALGMVIDFSEIRAVAKSWIDEHLDHKMLLHRDDPIATVLQEWDQPLYLMEGNPTAENIARLIFRHLRTAGLHISRVSLWETPTGCAIYSED